MTTTAEIVKFLTKNPIYFPYSTFLQTFDRYVITLLYSLGQIDTYCNPVLRAMMLRIFIHVLFIIFLVNHANAQKEGKKKRLYETWVTKTDGTKLTGLLNDVDDTKLLMDEIQFGYIDVYAHEIEKIQFRKLYQPRTGMAIGAIAGLFAGVAIAVEEGNSNIDDATEAILLYSIGLGALGTGVGAAIGSIKISISINGSVDQFKANQAHMSKYLFPRQYYE